MLASRLFQLTGLWRRVCYVGIGCGACAWTWDRIICGPALRRENRYWDEKYHITEDKVRS